jgi:predicted nuclease of restriction endonuclease-like RecB superfamily
MLTRQQALTHFDFESRRVVPDRLTRSTHHSYADYSEQMLRVYREGLGRPRRQLHRAVRAILARDATCPPRRADAFCKLLDDVSLYDADARRAAAALRRDVFRRAAKFHPLVATPHKNCPHTIAHTRTVIAADLGMSWREVQDRLFADVWEEQRLLRFDGYADASALLARYNVAQTQVVLFDALRLQLDAGADFKSSCGTPSWRG